MGVRSSSDSGAQCFDFGVDGAGRAPGSRLKRSSRSSTTDLATPECPLPPPLVQFPAEDESPEVLVPLVTVRCLVPRPKVVLSPPK